MAKIHGISGSTRYVLNGTRPINGRKLASLDEVIYFHKNYQVILAEKEVTASMEQDELIKSLGDNEARLDQKIKDDTVRRTVEVCTHLLDINKKVESSDSFFPVAAYLLQFWIANLLRPARINIPSYGTKWDLYLTRTRKTKTIANKPQTVQNACRSIIQTQRFLDNNATFLAGAHGEELVIQALSRLPDEYHVLNDVNLRFEKSIYWEKHREYIKTCQIDHVVVGPTGLFLLETKNWTKSNMQNRSDALIHQVNRANIALGYYLKYNYWLNSAPQIKKVVVSMHGFAPGQKSDPYIDAVTPDLLCNLITSKNETLSKDDIHKLVRLIPCREAN